MIFKNLLINLLHIFQLLPKWDLHHRFHHKLQMLSSPMLQYLNEKQNEFSSFRSFDLKLPSLFISLTSLPEAAHSICKVLASYPPRPRKTFSKQNIWLSIVVTVFDTQILTATFFVTCPTLETWSSTSCCCNSGTINNYNTTFANGKNSKSQKCRQNDGVHVWQC